MILISKTIERTQFSVDVRSSFCRLCTGDSGTGKTYWIGMLGKLLGNQGKIQLHIMYDNRAILFNILKEEFRPSMIVLDEVELYKDEIDVEEVRNHCENLWIISRKILKYADVQPTRIFMDVSEGECIIS